MGCMVVVLRYLDFCFQRDLALNSFVSSFQHRYPARTQEGQLIDYRQVGRRIDLDNGSA